MYLEAYKRKMNVQAHMSGQFSGQVPNPAGNTLSAVPRNGGSIPMQMPNSGGQRLNMDQDFVRVRKDIQAKIHEFLLGRQQRNELPVSRMLDVTRRLDEGLFKTATTKEEYMNLDTLENRLHVLIRRLPMMSKHNQQYHSSPSTGTMMPTPGVHEFGDA